MSHKLDCEKKLNIKITYLLQNAMREDMDSTVQWIVNMNVLLVIKTLENASVTFTQNASHFILLIAKLNIFISRILFNFDRELIA